MIFQSAATAFVTLFVSIGPFDVAAIFLVLTANAEFNARRRMAVRACLIAFAILLVFTFGGIHLLDTLEVGLPAFRAAGGILLLGVARDLVFARHSGLSSITPGEEQEAAAVSDVAVFPLAIPLTAGPGSITAMVLLAGRTHTQLDMIILLGALTLVILLTLTVMLTAARLVKILGTTGINVIARISGILLSAVAMQFIFDGLRDSGLLH